MNFERITPIQFDELDSTNAEAMRMLKRSKPIEGTCVVAGFQTEGRGQRSNSWYSRPGENLLVSFILYPPSKVARQPFHLSKALALAVRNTIASFTTGSVQIKWPNDILIDGKKVAGILIENQWTGSNWQAAIAGIGINVNQTISTLDHATSLAKQSGRAFTINLVLKELQTQLAHEYTRLCNGAETSINEDYHQQLFGKDEYFPYQTPIDQFKAKVLQVSEDGLLQLLKVNGEISSYNLSEVQLIY